MRKIKDKQTKVFVVIFSPHVGAFYVWLQSVLVKCSFYLLSCSQMENASDSGASKHAQTQLVWSAGQTGQQTKALLIPLTPKVLIKWTCA